MAPVHSTFLILSIVIVLFIWDKIRSDLVALISVIALVLCGVLTPGQALGGFGDSTVIMIAGLYVVGEGLSRTGVTTWLGQNIIRIAGKSALRVLIVLMLGTALLSAFMSNTGTVATLMPAVIAIAWSIGSLPSKLLMPLAFAANAGGLLTLTGTPPNIVVSEALVNSGYEPIGFFEFSYVGLPLLLLTILYMVFVGQKLLPKGQMGDKPDDLDSSMLGISESFSLQGKLFLAYIEPGCSLVGKRLGEVGLGENYTVTVLRIEEQPAHTRAVRSKRVSFQKLLRDLDPHAAEMLPGSGTLIEEHSVMVLKGSSRAIKRAAEDFGFEIEEIRLDPGALSKVLVSSEVGVAEVLITPRSTYRGRTVSDSNFIKKFGVQVLSIRRGESLVTRKDTGLEFGDALLVRGKWRNIARLRHELRNFTVIGTPNELSRQVVSLNWRSLIAVLSLVGMVTLMVTKVLSAVMAVLIAAVVKIGRAHV